MNLSVLRDELDRYVAAKEAAPRGAAVLIPLVEVTSGPEILFEVRAATLVVQPGEVCLPGGSIEPGEDPQTAAIRETCEELEIESRQICVIGSMGVEPGPGGRPLHVYVGTIDGYEGTFSPAEVERTFTLPIAWLATHEPEVFEVKQTPSYPEDFPWDLVPGGKSYAWRAQTHRVPFYRGTDPLVWGATARIIMNFARIWRTGQCAG